jgi:hypothetical protein
VAIPLPTVADTLAYASTTMTPFLPYVAMFTGVGLGLAAISYVIRSFSGR